MQKMINSPLVSNKTNTKENPPKYEDFLFSGYYFKFEFQFVGNYFTCSKSHALNL